MSRGQRRTKSISADEAGAFDDFHTWVLSLPWVVEWPSWDSSAVRRFAIDCEPLGRRRLCLVTGLESAGGSGGLGLAVVFPREAANDIEAAGWGRFIAPVPHQQALLTVESASPDQRRSAEALVLAAYCYALS